VVGSLGPDRSGSEGSSLVRAAEELGAAYLLVEGPEAQSPEQLKTRAQRSFREVIVGRFATTAFGESLYRRRWYLFAAAKKKERRRVWSRALRR
jgi:hypothetical protein